MTRASRLRPGKGELFPMVQSAPTTAVKRRLISSPRSLSKTTRSTPWRESMLSMNPIKTDFPEPVGPQMKVCPVSLRLPPSGSLGSLA